MSFGSLQLIHLVCVNILKLMSLVPSFLCKKKGFLQNGHMFIFLNQKSSMFNIIIMIANNIIALFTLNACIITHIMTKVIGGNTNNMVFFLDISLLYAIFVFFSIYFYFP